MKKFLLIVACALTTAAGMANETKTFTDQLEVSVNGTSSTQQTTVSVEMLEDNYINFVLENFVLEADGDELNVGNIEISNLFLRDKGDYKSFSYNANLKIKPGNMAGVAEDEWMGPMLGNVPLILNGKLTDNKVYVTIDIDMMESIQQVISVKFGSDFAAATVANTLSLQNTLSTKSTSTYVEDYGQEMVFDDINGFATVVEELNTTDINLCLYDVVLSIGTETAPLGQIVVNGIETIDRGAYKEFNWTGDVDVLEGLCPAVLKGKYNGQNIYYTLSIDADAISQIIDFKCGSDFAPAAVEGAASKYADKLVVSVNETTTDPMDANVEVEHLNNGGINFVLKNFVMELEGNEMKVGNIAIEDLPLYDGNGYKYFNYTGNLNILPGELAGTDEEDWIGPMLGNIPLRLKGRLTNDKLYVELDIDMVSLDQIIHVVFGSEIESAISGIVADAQKGGAIYDLQGRRVQNATKGIYIVNGKKVVK